MRETTLLADRVDSLTRGAADAMTRRSSVRALSAAVIIAAATGVPAVAKKGKKGKKCKRSTETCEAAITAACASAPDPEACLQGLLPCCDFVGRCKPSAALECIFEAFLQEPQ